METEKVFLDQDDQYRGGNCANLSLFLMVHHEDQNESILHPYSSAATDYHSFSWGLHIAFIKTTLSFPVAP